MDKYIPQIKEIVGDEHLKLMLHSIAFGTTTNFFGEKPVTQRQMDMTVHVMGTHYCTGQKLLAADLIGNGSRILGLTSEGNYLAMEGYGPVSVAKSSYGGHNQTNRMGAWRILDYCGKAIQAGITPTRALTKITDRWETWVENTKKKKPYAPNNNTSGCCKYSKVIIRARS